MSIFIKSSITLSINPTATHSLVQKVHRKTFCSFNFLAFFQIYALKYLEDLKPALQEVNRILRPGGFFLVYDLLKTDKYHSSSEEHKTVIKNLEYACGMPPLHTK